MKTLLLLVLLKLSVTTGLAKSKYPEIFPVSPSDKNVPNWEHQREVIKEDLQKYIYGYLPNSDLGSSFELVKSIEDAGENVLYQEFEVSFNQLPSHLKMKVSVFAPLNRTHEKLTAIMALNKCGVSSLWKADYVRVMENVRLHPRCNKRKFQIPGSYSESYPIKEILKAGYVFATINEAELREDNGKIKNSRFVEAYPSSDEPNKNWGALSAWAFGLIRGLDVLETISYIDPDKLILFGHSRRGKAALLATAMDEKRRVAMVIPHQSGTGGVAPFRGSFGRESARGMVGYGLIRYSWLGEPYHLAHWFNPGFQNFARFNNKFPVDTHQLLSLAAPAKIFDIQGTRDFWAGPNDSLKNLDRPQEIYKLYGKAGKVQKSCLRTFPLRKYWSPTRKRWITRKHRCDSLDKNLSPEKLGDVFQVRLKKGHSLKLIDWQAVFKVLSALNY